MAIHIPPPVLEGFLPMLAPFALMLAMAFCAPCRRFFLQGSPCPLCGQRLLITVRR